jgi:hypothetical protein
MVMAKYRDPGVIAGAITDASPAAGTVLADTFNNSVSAGHGETTLMVIYFVVSSLARTANRQPVASYDHATP